MGWCAPRAGAWRQRDHTIRIGVARGDPEGCPRGLVKLLAEDDGFANARPKKLHLGLFTVGARITHHARIGTRR